MAHTSPQPNESLNLTISHDGSGPSEPTTQSSPQPPHDIANDYEANEGPVREKLKKTSIASLSDHIEPHSKAGAEEEQIQSDKRDTLKAKAPSTGRTLEAEVEGRGRPLRKRSFEDSGADKETEKDLDKAFNRSNEGRQRKKSKEVYADRVAWTETQECGLLKSPVPEELEGGSSVGEMPVPSTVAKTQTKLDSEHRSAAEDIGDQEVGDQEMSDHLFSPRKKRSRDPLDADPHREQKIVATEEARAHRRSEEFERSDILPVKDNGEQMNGTLMEGPTPEHVERLSIKEKHQDSGFTNTSTTSPFASLSNPNSFPRASPGAIDSVSDPGAPTLTSEHGSNSLTGHSKSFASPFGLLPSSTTFTPYPFSSAKIEDKSVQATAQGNNIGSNSSNSLTGSSDSKSTVMAPSPFSSIGSSGSSFAQNAFGSHLGANNFGGPKLMSFAVPGADPGWGGTGTIKPFGAPGAKTSDDENSDSDGDAEAPVESETDAGEPDSRFQQQEVDTGEEGELSIFTANRASLFAFEDGKWKERGRGVFKLNITPAQAGDPNESRKKGRFIMRAQQTYRILLNAPVFKQMQVGDSKGKEPPGNQVSLAVVEGGKPTPYLVRLGDSNEAKTLYKEIQELQKGL